jgi:hypothetical protein
MYLIKLSFREAIVRIMVVVYNATFNNISVISWSFDFIGEGNREKPPTDKNHKVSLKAKLKH